MPHAARKRANAGLSLGAYSDRQTLVSCRCARSMTCRTIHFNANLYLIPADADEQVPVMLSDILPIGFEFGH